MHLINGHDQKVDHISLINDLHRFLRGELSISLGYRSASQSEDDQGPSHNGYLYEIESGSSFIAKYRVKSKKKVPLFSLLFLHFDGHFFLKFPITLDICA